MLQEFLKQAVKDEVFPGCTAGRERACQCRQKTWVQSLSQDDSLEKEMAAHCNILS